MSLKDRLRTIESVAAAFGATVDVSDRNLRAKACDFAVRKGSRVPEGGTHPGREGGRHSVSLRVERGKPECYELGAYADEGPEFDDLLAWLAGARRDLRNARRATEALLEEAFAVFDVENSARIALVNRAGPHPSTNS